MSAEAKRSAAEFPLDDDLWRYRRDRIRRFTWWAPWLLALSVGFLLVSVIFWGTTALRNALLASFFVGFLASSVALVGRLGFEGPVRMNLTPKGINFYWARGKRRELGYKPGIKIGLYDAPFLKLNSTLVLRIGKDIPPRGNYLLLNGHSLTNEPFALTKEAFDAIKQAMLSLGATRLRDGPIAPGSSASLTEFRIPERRGERAANQ